MCGSRNYYQRGSNLDKFFLVGGGGIDEGQKNPDSTISNKRAINCHLNGVCWWADDGPTLNASLVALWFFRGSRPVLQRNPIFCDFSGVGGGVRTLCPSPPPL